MKYKVIGSLFCVAVLLISSVNFSLLMHLGVPRCHQHLEAQEKEACMHGDDLFCTHLPLISIDTGEIEIPGKAIKEGNEVIGYTTAEAGSDRITAQIEAFDSKNYNNHLTDTPAITSNMTIHVRGNSSRAFDKLGYRIKLIDENGQNNPQALLGMDSHHEWALHGPILDKTLMRNYMWYNIAGEIMRYAPNVRFCELILNGEYMGVYVFTEVITAGKNGSRLDLTSGYLLLLDHLDGEEQNHLKSFTTYTLRTKNKLAVIYPGALNMTDEIFEGIKNDFSAFEKSLYTYDYDNNKYGYKRCIDVDSFVDYFLINEFTCNYDAGWLSTFIYKDTDGIFRMCIWDFNASCDNDQQAYMPENQFKTQFSLWYFMLCKDEDFTNRCIERYRELRKTFLNEQYLYEYIDSVVDYLGPAIERNYEKWGYQFSEEYDVLEPMERNPRDYADSIEKIKKFIHIRGSWMDENIETLSQYSAESKVKKFNENAN